MPEYLFVYGTLRSEIAPSWFNLLAQNWPRIGAGYTHGRLYDFGEYPGGRLDAGCDESIIGEVLELPEGDSLADGLDALDRYEGINGEDQGASSFVRTRCNVILENRHEIECWIYVYNGEIASANLIESGDYLGNRSHS
jgi:gamma-glutamylcyclotransferase (GGCT)/AIG2-like uncharacterized protein YtfP